MFLTIKLYQVTIWFYLWRRHTTDIPVFPSNIKYINQFRGTTLVATREMSIFYDKKCLKLFSPDLSCERFEVFWVFPVGLRGGWRQHSLNCLSTVRLEHSQWILIWALYPRVRRDCRRNWSLITSTRISSTTTSGPTDISSVNFLLSLTS